MSAGKNDANLSASPPRKLRILMISEFFHPDIGGIEKHVYMLSKHLVKQGHRVVILTRNYDGRNQIRYMSGGLKVYHLPTFICYAPCGWPLFLNVVPVVRKIILRENIDLLHYHQTASNLGYILTQVGYCMGYRSVFTDHSLLSFSELGPAFLSEAACHVFLALDHAICVSNTLKENITLRLQVDPRKISTIGNAIDASAFTPAEHKRNDGRIVIVIISRLTVWKGIDMLKDVIPIVCKRHENVDFIIGGDGPLYSNIVELLDKLYLHNRVTLLGSIPPYEVNDVLKKGDIFLNTSRSESFCIGVLEAASSGLLCVCTNVGGLREILPRDMVLLANYTPESIVNRIDEAIKMLGNVDRHSFHRRVKELYSWEKVTNEVSKVYYKVIGNKRGNIFQLIWEDMATFTVFQAYVILIVIAVHIEWAILEILQPRSEIDMAPDWSEAWRKANGITVSDTRDGRKGEK